MYLPVKEEVVTIDEHVVIKFTGACGIIWKSDRYMVSAFFIKRVTNSY